MKTAKKATFPQKSPYMATAMASAKAKTILIRYSHFFSDARLAQTTVTPQ
jgi:hypothetical protein